MSYAINLRLNNLLFMNVFSDNGTNEVQSSYLRDRRIQHTEVAAVGLAEAVAGAVGRVGLAAGRQRSPCVLLDVGQQSWGSRPSTRQVHHYALQPDLYHFEGRSEDNSSSPYSYRCIVGASMTPIKDDKGIKQGFWYR